MVVHGPERRQVGLLAKGVLAAAAVGARNAGVEMVGAVDAWDLATRTYADNFPTVKRNAITTRLDDNSCRPPLGSLSLLRALLSASSKVSRGERQLSPDTVL